MNSSKQISPSPLASQRFKTCSTLCGLAPSRAKTCRISSAEMEPLPS
eukprot:CAMPEP_0115459984 /NCGR_PEP_ID=MMETSP0271-20121206/46542_1 /TAXON_ID=71861 /ORGANISM="Scrippsiella trochoidea, Strain CCMP3099" /LENGTH=46 /DNA_ID= /DNA_START= /DNA_END= /DNA_ORIENTATION=